jgi:type I restriction enzyme M protein
MSPKGGIRPHNRFSVQSKRSEVLFVDYMAEHLTPSGRAGIIVPEGIIFQSQTAYTQLRKMLVEEFLVAVVSLPAGVFNPYSGVKTSVLILDKSVAKTTDTIAFFKVEADGFSLGAQRRAVDKDDLPKARAEIGEYLRRVHVGESVAELQPTLGLVVGKRRIAENGEYNLSAERYRENATRTSRYPIVPLGEVCSLVRGVTYKKGDEVDVGGHQVLRANNITRETGSLDLSDIKRVSAEVTFPEDKRLRRNDVFICLASGSKDHIGKAAFIPDDTEFYFGGFMGAVRAKQDRLNPEYLFHQLRQSRFNDFLRDQIAGASINNLGATLLYRFELPLPPLEVQTEIVAEIEGHQTAIAQHEVAIEDERRKIGATLARVWGEDEAILTQS